MVCYSLFSDAQQQGLPPPFLRSIQELLGFLNPANAVAGDAVYSQEALDRIISNLMEADPQSNAAPPASDDALNRLERRPVDSSMLDGESKIECPICIDDLEEGHTAMFLPCKHFFHQDCVVLWLKEHNTCPICRTPIEKNGRGADRNRQGGQPGAGASSSGSGRPGSQRPPEHPILRMFGEGMFQRSGGGGENTHDVLPGQAFSNRSTPNRPSDAPHNQSHSRYFFMDSGPSTRTASTRLPRHNPRRSDQVLQGMAGWQRDPEGNTTESGVDTSRRQRRPSLSPTGPRTGSLGDQGSHVRRRSPSESSSRWANNGREAAQQRSSGPSGRGSGNDSNKDNGSVSGGGGSGGGSGSGSGSGGPLSWFRNRFGSDYGNGSSSRDRRGR